MAYYIDLFSPETYQAFNNSDRSISGFRERHKGIASSIKPGDKLICYITKLSRWIGLLEVKESFFIDDTPIFIHPVDPFEVRFKVTPTVWLSHEHAIPISNDICWKHLSFTRDLPPKSSSWTGMVRGSLRRFDDEDGVYLEKILLQQAQNPKAYRLSDVEKKKAKLSIINTANSQVVVSVPDNESESKPSVRRQQTDQYESTKMQALLAEIGERMNLKVWLPRNDRQRVLEIWHPKKTLAF